MLSGRSVRAHNSDGEITFTATLEAPGSPNIVGINDAAGVGSTTAPDPPIARGIRINQLGPTILPNNHDMAIQLYGPLNSQVPFRSNHFREMLVDDHDDVQQTLTFSDATFYSPSTYGYWEWGDGTDLFWSAADDAETKEVILRWGYRDV